MIKISDMKLGIKLAINFLIIGVLPALSISWIALSSASDSLSQQAFQHLESVRAIKKAQLENLITSMRRDMNVMISIQDYLRVGALEKLENAQRTVKVQVESYFQQQLRNIGFLSQESSVANVFIALTSQLETSSKDAGSSAANTDLALYSLKYGFADLFLINQDGLIVYNHSGDYEPGQNVTTAGLKDTLLDHAFQAGLKGISLHDFQAGSATGVDPEIFAVVSAPVSHSGKILGVVAGKLAVESINNITQNREGLGKTGETYLAGKTSDRISFRSNPMTIGDGKYVVGYDFTDFAPPYVIGALSGQQRSGIYPDSTNNLVMAVANPLTIRGLHWAAVTKMSPDEIMIRKLKGEDKDFLAKYADQMGFSDLFLVHPNGHVYYSVAKGKEYNDNLFTGPYNNYGLAKLFLKILELQQFQFQDIASYAPNNNKPSAFIGQPFIPDGEMEFVMMARIALGDINAIMHQRDGMGQTGETYLVGPDQRMRSDSLIDAQDHSVEASFSGSIEKNGVDTIAVREALAGKTGTQVISDYRGNLVLSAYAPVNMGGVTWALIAEIDEAEAFAAVRQLRWMIGAVLMVSLAVIILLAWLVSRAITHPLKAAVAVAHQIAGGDLSAAIKVDSKDETGQLLQAMKTMTIQLGEIVGNVTQATAQVSSAAAEIAQGSADLSQRTEKQASALEETASSMEELTSTVKQSADHARQANQLASAARTQAEQGGQVADQTITAMSAINASSRKIADIISVIDEIAFQTNLLALNAAVEAARAGEQGRGFAVVAGEVRKLAQRSADAAKEIKGLITDSVSKVEDGGKLVERSRQTLKEIVASVKKVSDIVAEMAAATREQATGIEQVNKAILQMDQVTQQNAALVEETAAASHVMGEQAHELQQLMDFFTLDQQAAKP